MASIKLQHVPQEEIEKSNDDCAKLGRRIRKFRIEANLSQGKLAQRADCHRLTIVRYELDADDMTLDILCNIANALCVPISELVDIPRSASHVTRDMLRVGHILLRNTTACTKDALRYKVSAAGVAKKLEEKREADGDSAFDFAHRINMDPKDYDTFSDAKTVMFSRIKSIADVLGMRVSDFITPSDEQILQTLQQLNEEHRKRLKDLKA